MKTEDVRATAPHEVKISLSKRKEKKEKQKKLIRLVVFLAVLFVMMLVIILTLFLKINKIEVTGNVTIPTEKIMESSGITVGKSILTLDSEKTKEKIMNAVPGISEIKIVKRLPSNVTIEVKEAEEKMFLAAGSGYYSLDADLCVVKKYGSIEEAEMEGLKKLLVPGIKKCIVGEKLELEDDDIPDMVRELYAGLVKYDLVYDVAEIDFRDKFDIIFLLGVKYKIKLGNILECDSKLEFLCSIIKELSPDEIGTIDFSDGNINEAIFSRG